MLDRSAAAGETMEEEIEYMWRHPPRCLGGNALEAGKELRHLLTDQLGCYSTVFEAHCSCGSGLLTLSGSSDSSLVKIACHGCGEERVVFDGSQHGYDGELGLGPREDPVTAPAYHCAACSHGTHEVALAFQYSGETDVLDDEDAPEIRPEDLFGWLMVGVRCHACGALAVVVDYECA